mgnify:CR=1 FL=1
MAALALSVYCQEDDDLYSISPEDFDLYEMYKKNPENIESSPFLKDEQRYDLRLHLFYEVLKSNPYVKGLPDYKKFKSSLQNPEISEGFYNSLRLNENLKHYVPVTYDDFAEVLGLPQKPSENYCDEEYIRLAQEYLRLQEEYRSTSEQQRRYERNRAVIDASSAIIDAITGSMGATIPDRYNQNQYDDEDNYSIYPTIPGTDVRDYNRSGAIIEGNSIIIFLLIFIIGTRFESVFSSTISILITGGMIIFFVFALPPQKIMTGSAGKSVYGFLICLLSLVAEAKLSTSLILLIVPLLDFAYVIIKRYLTYKPKSFTELMKINMKLSLKLLIISKQKK